MEETFGEVIGTRGATTTYEVDVSGFGTCRLLIGSLEDATGQGVGSGGIRVDIEKSMDNRQSWQQYSHAEWAPGAKLSSRQIVGDRHYIEERAFDFIPQLDANGNQIIVVVPSIFPQGQWFRVSGRYMGPGDLVLSSELIPQTE